MLGLAAPAWLAALAALAVPLAIHLWTRRPARVIRVASIRHFVGAPVHARRLHLDDPWLLLVRAALLAVVVVMLARPYFASGADEAPGTWVLVDPVLLDSAVRRVPPLGGDGTAVETAARLLDSLRLAGTPIRLLAPGLPQFSWDEPPPARSAPHADLWSLMREAEYTAPSGTRFLVIAQPRLPADAGERPRIGVEVRWVAAWSAPGERTAEAERRTQAGESDTVLRGALVFAEDERLDEARYAAAALEAAAGDRLRDGAARVLPLDSAEAAASGARRGDWLVWLADRPLPAALTRALESGATVLSDGGDTAAPRADMPPPAAQELLLADGLAPVTVHGAPLSGVRLADAGVPLWEMADGRALLTAQPVGRGLRLVYGGRFDAASSDLVLQPAFPELVARLWLAGMAPQPDPVPVTVNQIMPAGRSAAAVARLAAVQAGARSTPRRDLTSLLWLAALVLLVGERLLAARRRQPSAGVHVTTAAGNP